MKRFAISLNWIALLALALVAAGCGKSHLDPHQAYKKRQQAGVNPFTGADEPYSVRIATVSGLAKVKAPDLQAALREMLLVGKVDIVIMHGLTNPLRESVTQTGTATGHVFSAGPRIGTGVLSRFPVLGREGERVGYPFGAFLLRLPRGQQLWAISAETSGLKPDMVPSAAISLAQRMEVHGTEAQMVAVGYQAALPDTDVAFRRELASNGWPLMTGNAGAEIYAFKDSASRLASSTDALAAISPWAAKLAVVSIDYQLVAPRPAAALNSLEAAPASGI